MLKLLRTVNAKISWYKPRLTGICKIGKILYKPTDKAKLNDYTFSYLMKQVRRVEKPEEPKPLAPTPAE